MASRGAIQVFRFYVGRNAPADLAAKKRANRMNFPRGRRVYSAAGLADMLIGRENITFRALTGWLPHMVHTVFPQLLCLPPVYRSLAEDLLRVTALAVIGMAAGPEPPPLGPRRVCPIRSGRHSRSAPSRP